ncbi:NAD(P)-binding protein [Aspergillus sclerotioniger CBS 115572]|uniref:NAD(P)-binding protein n=1 Tax=Aspergillus sclerotioniger CBS 115572 TaxID=1450535 RepID=A0A317XBQ4_9EURO|nr:NAD(P)-binding protein [Aspergillus sclerotioniger CBS 115572]PWY96064.1 NAD(P)-binding protein [Aspergillus sclerotioniger CBS 115572]
MSSPFVAVAGATGQLGSLVAQELRKRGVTVKALVRPNTDPSRTAVLRDCGVYIIPVDLADQRRLTQEFTGATCVVSTLQGLANVIHTAQGTLLDAAVAAQVPRFIPSDFSLDFTKTKPGSNRNLDLRREFHKSLERAPIASTSILNGGFMDLMGGDSPMINHKKGKVMYVGSATQLLDFTTVADTAAYTAAVAADTTPTPRFLRIAGDVLSAQGIADAAGQVYGKTYKPSWMGSIGFLEGLIRVLRLFGGEDQIMPVWQGMQYMVNIFSGAGKLDPLDNDRYPELKWTKVVEVLREYKNKR